VQVQKAMRRRPKEADSSGTATIHKEYTLRAKLI
jgi:hypothetical protein